MRGKAPEREPGSPDTNLQEGVRLDHWLSNFLATLQKKINTLHRNSEVTPTGTEN